MEGSFKSVFIIYLIFINIYGYWQMASDKRKAKKHRWRVPEKRLWTVAAIGGAFGSYLAMRQFRHKTQHASFKVGMPLFCIIYGFLLIVFFLKS